MRGEPWEGVHPLFGWFLGEVPGGFDIVSKWKARAGLFCKRFVLANYFSGANALRSCHTPRMVPWTARHKAPIHYAPKALQFSKPHPF